MTDRLCGTHRHPDVQKHLRSYRRYARNQREDLMKETLAEINNQIAPHMSPSERRRVYRSILASKKAFQKETPIELIPIYKERMRSLNAKRRWEELRVFVCKHCKVVETNNPKKFPKLIPCGHRSMCEECASKEKECPCCFVHIDHKLTRYLRCDKSTASQFIKIVEDIKKSDDQMHVRDLRLLRRATLARVRDMRKNGEGQVVASTPGDRTAKLLNTLGKHAGLSEDQMQTLENEFEATVRMASSKESFRDGSKKLVKLFHLLTKPNQIDYEHEGVRSQDSHMLIEKKFDTFSLADSEMSFHTTSSHYEISAEVMWGYNIKTPIQDASIRELPYVCSDPKIHMARFKARLVPIISKFENDFREAEMKRQEQERDYLRGMHNEKRELLEMLYEDRYATRSRLMLQGRKKMNNEEHEGLEKVNEHFKELEKKCMSMYGESWIKNKEKGNIVQREFRMNRFCKQMKLLEGINDILCFYDSLKHQQPFIQRILKEAMMNCKNHIKFELKVASSPDIDSLSLLMKKCALFSRGISFGISIEYSDLQNSDVISSALSVPSLTSLKIKNCNLVNGKTYADAFFPAPLKTYAPNLCSLDLSHLGLKLKQPNRLEFVSNLKNLRELDLSHNKLESDVGVIIGRILMNGVQLLKMLNVSWNFLGAKGCTAILDATRSVQKLRKDYMTIDISYNCWRLGELNLKVDGMCIIAESRQPGNIYDVKMRHPVARTKTPDMRRKPVQKEKSRKGESRKKKGRKK